MHKPVPVIFLVSALFTVNTFSQQAPRPAAAGRAAGPEARLPIRRVVLYKNGVGYFEHSERVRGNQDLHIDFTTAQLNDVLKSLTVVDLGGGRITAVRFNSVAPLGERLKALHLPLGEQTSRAQFLEALRGTRVEVRSGAEAATGRVLSVETKKKIEPKGGEVSDALDLSLVTDSGDLRCFEMSPGASVRLADREAIDDVSRYLDLIGSAKGLDFRRITISAAGAGERNVFVSYISEVPVWKSTYRVLLDGKTGGEALVQGWAIVDNTIGEDWNDVELSLISGAPESFVQSISLPYYAPRPVVPLPESVSLSPQTYEAAVAPASAPGEGGGMGSGFGVRAYSVGGTGLTGVVKDQSGAGIPNAKVTLRNEESGASMTILTDSQGKYAFNNVQGGNSALFVESPGFQKYALSNIFLGFGRMNEINATLNVGTMAQTVEVRANAPSVNTESAGLAAVAEEEGPEAEGKAVGELFEYKIKEKVTLDKNQSALVPILQSRMKAQKVTVWNEDSEQARRALWVTNTSGETLDAGPFNVLEDGTFAGEGLLETIRPGDRRLISYAADPLLAVRKRVESAERPFTRIRIAKGMMLMTQEERATAIYTISNMDAQDREVIIEHPLRPEWTLAGDAKPQETTTSNYRFRIEVGPKQTAKLIVDGRHPENTEIALTDLKSDNVTLLANEKRLTTRMEEAFRQILDQKTAIADVDAQVEARQHEADAISGDQSRIRENMKALKGSAEEKALLERYTQELNSQEDHLAALRTEISNLKVKRQEAAKKLDETLVSITLDETF
ncbi:MAG: hypothetical protein DMG22_00040 [Acidobacteria bacterium]|nr:MAG: hypothetical protein DMG22_00040 [Acidobacteriota bacterium]